MRRFLEWVGGWLRWISRPRSQRTSLRHSQFTRRRGFRRHMLAAQLHCWRCDRMYRVVFPCRYWHKGHVSIPCECGASVMEAVAWR